MDWLDYTANARIHQTTLQKPFDLLAQEQLQLQPVPKPYLGIHPLKASHRSITDQQTQAAKKMQSKVHIPQRDLQSYDAFIPATVAYLLTYSMITGGVAWQ